eukprot:NODE_2_length_91304_cov_0.692462.p67 type:complete len:152 gc:universal NODE_2_length_91304_cov_0.692462:33107-32652(-)
MKWNELAAILSLINLKIYNPRFKFLMERVYSKITQAIVKTIRSSNSLRSVIVPIASKYQDLAGYRKVGLKYDDLLRTEDEAVKKAIKRLPKEELQQRMYRQKRAMQLSINQKEEVPKGQQLSKMESDMQLTKLVRDVEREIDEKQHYDNLK